MIFPGAEAMMSTSPSEAQARPRQNRAIIVTPIARPIGEGGVSTISSAAGRNANSCRSRRAARGSGITFVAEGSTLVDGSADFMDACLEPVEGGVPAAAVDQIIMGAIFDDAAAIKRNNPVG